jgi:hypothetical protein
MKYEATILTAILIAVSAAGVTACEQVPNTTIARSVEDGARVEKSWVRTWRDRARFECVASTSGACRVVVFVSECPGAACSTKVVRELELVEGQAADLLKLPPGFRYCLQHGRKPVAPACANS